LSPLTHLLASWLIAAKTTDNPRDCRLVSLAGVMPDADGLGLALDLANRVLGTPETGEKPYCIRLTEFGCQVTVLLLHRPIAGKRNRPFGLG